MVILIEFRQDLWCKKTTVLRLLPCDIDCVMTGLAVLIELGLVTDGQTNGHRAIAHAELAQHRTRKNAHVSTTSVQNSIDYLCDVYFIINITQNV